MTPELKSAAERYRKFKAGDLTAYSATGTWANEQFRADAYRLASAMCDVMDDESRRAAEEARPLTREILLGRGWKCESEHTLIFEGIFHKLSVEFYLPEYSDYGPRLHLGGLFVADNPTVGTLNHLESALGIEPKKVGE